MLSHVANSLYWMVRYVERADNLARLIDVNQQMLLDNESLDSERLRAFWRPIILSTGDEELFNRLYDNAGSSEVVRFLTDDESNPNSIVFCILQARENARTVRDQLSEDLWEELNGLFLYIRSEEAKWLRVSNPQRFYENIRRSAVTFLGIASSTTMRGEQWDFMELGRHLERADKTTRFLDVVTYLSDGDEEAATGTVHWPAILRSCGALGAFRSSERSVTALSVVNFLIFSRNFPRSVRFCIDRVDVCIHRISGSERGTFCNRAERESGKLLADLNYGLTSVAFSVGLHHFLDNLQVRFNAIGDAVFNATC